MKSLLAALPCLVLVPTLARAQDSAGPTECVTTTTVTTRCTGSAASLAVPQPLTPVPELAPAAPLPTAQPAAPAPPPPILVVPRGLGLVVGPDGLVYRERRRRQPLNGMVAAGLTIFAVTYLATAIGDMVTKGMPFSFIPVLGPGVSAVSSAFSGDGSPGLLIASSILQATSFVVGMVGIGSGPEKLERLPVTLAPVVSTNGAGVSLTGRF